MEGLLTSLLKTGRLGYHPSVLLRLFLYGCLNRIQSSHRMERGSNWNVELVWLTGRLAPDFKTIADFWKDNGPAIQAACGQFIILWHELGLFARRMVVIDGATFKAVNAREKNFIKGKLTRRIGQIETSIEGGLSTDVITSMHMGLLERAATKRFFVLRNSTKRALWLRPRYSYILDALP